MKIYTRRGDKGQTGLFGGGRVPKDAPRVEAYGTVDEFNATLGVVVATLQDQETKDRLFLIQSDLFALGAHLATPPQEGNRPAPHLPELPVGRIDEMEAWIDAVDEEVGPLKQFLLPGGTVAAAQLHFARTVCRRAERAIVTLAGVEVVEADILRYINRLSDLLFAQARLENHRNGSGDVLWVQES